MNVVPLVTCLAALAATARADGHCVHPFTSDICIVRLSVVPQLEELGFLINDLRVSVGLTATKDDRPLAETKYSLFSKPMTKAKLDQLSEMDLRMVSVVFQRDILELHCSDTRSPGQEDPPLAFVRAGGAVSYEIELHLKNSSGDTVFRPTFGQTMINDCEAP
jgi:hypothetical protein